MTAPTVRMTKRADELTPGDWTTDLAPPASKVLSTYPYSDGDDRVMVIYEDPDGLPATLHLMAHTPMELATDGELARLREIAERAGRITEIRAFADWLEGHPDAPLPYASFQADLHDEDGIAWVRQFAESIGRPVRQIPDRTQVEVNFGQVRYTAIAWHRDGIPAEPATDPTGLDYSREADDPTPVSPARIAPHLGDAESQILTNGKLVGEPGAGPVVTHPLIESGCE